jgi:hypothetical protein
MTNQTPSFEEALAHFGVPGMKWGRHKLKTADIKEARRQVSGHKLAIAKATTKEEKRAAIDAMRADPNSKIAAKRTRGEKNVRRLLATTGVVGLPTLATIGAVKVSSGLSFIDSSQYLFKSATGSLTRMDDLYYHTESAKAKARDAITEKLNGG